MRSDFCLWFQFTHHVVKGRIGIVSRGNEPSIPPESPLEETVRSAELPTSEAVFGNVNTIIAYRLGGGDSATIAGEFGRQFPATALLTIPNYQFYATTVNGEGIPTDPKIYRVFETLPKIRPVFHEVEKSKLIDTSLQMWSKDRTQVSANLEKFLASPP